MQMNWCHLSSACIHGQRLLVTGVPYSHQWQNKSSYAYWSLVKDTGIFKKTLYSKERSLKKSGVAQVRILAAPQGMKGVYVPSILTTCPLLNESSGTGCKVKQLRNSSVLTHFLITPLNTVKLHLELFYRSAGKEVAFSEFHFIWFGIPLYVPAFDSSLQSELNLHVWCSF